jgi:hypothetical protein
VRDTSTDKVLKVYEIKDEKPSLADLEDSNLTTPSGEPEVGSGNFTVRKT